MSLKYFRREMDNQQELWFIFNQNCLLLQFNQFFFQLVTIQKQCSLHTNKHKTYKHCSFAYTNKTVVIQSLLIP